MNSLYEAAGKFLTKIAAGLAAFFAGFFAGTERQKRKEAEDDATDAKAEAQRWADAPGTDADFHSVMRTRIKRKREANDDDHAG